MNNSAILLRFLLISLMIFMNVDPSASSGSPLPLIVFPISGIAYSLPPTSVQGEWREKGEDVMQGTIKFYEKLSRGYLTILCPIKANVPEDDYGTSRNVNPDDENCNYPMRFHHDDPLKCVYEPKPFISALTKKNDVYPFEGRSIPCGPGQKGKMYSFSYKICMSKYLIEYENIGHFSFPNKVPIDLQYRSKFEVFRFCYDDQSKQILHTEHKIMSPGLLFDNRLQRERDIIYETMLDDRNIFMLDLKMSIDKFQNIQTAASDSGKKGYKLQPLAPTEDFAFALWRKTTYHLLNQKIMRADLVELWAHICQRIRESALKREMDNDFRYFVHTGAYAYHIIRGELEIIQPESKIPDVWLKKIYSCRYDPSEEEKERCDALFIFMDQNFDNDSAIDQSKLNCEKNLCENAFTKKFPQVGKSIRCCSVSEDYEAEKNNIVIRNVMKTDFLHDDDEGSFEE